MGAYGSLLPTDRQSALGAFLQPMAEGFAGGIEDDRVRRRNISDRVDAYKSLMPYQMETFQKQHEILGTMQAQRDDAALRKALLLEGYKRSMDPEHAAQMQLGKLVGQPVSETRPAGSPFPVEDSGEAMGKPESWTGKTSQPVTSPGVDPRLLASLAIQAKYPYKDLQGILKFASGGGPGEPESKAADWAIDRDLTSGKVQRINKLTGKVFDIPGATNTERPAFPWNENTISGVQAGTIPLPPGVTQDQVEGHRKGLIDIRGKSTGARVGGGLDAQGDRVQLISNIAEAKALGGLTDDVIRQRTIQANALQNVMVQAAQSKSYQSALGKFKAELAEDETGTTFGAALQEARTSGKPLSGAAADSVVKYNQYLRASNTLRKEYSNAEILKYVGLGKFQAKQLEQFMQTDPRFMRFMVLNEQLRGTAFGEGGKQLTPFEASVVFGYTPTGREAWGEYYLAKLEEIGPRFETLLSETLKAHKTSRSKFAPSEMPGLSTTPQAVGQSTKPAGAHRLSGTKTTKPDAVYPLKDGTSITVKGGVVQ